MFLVSKVPRGSRLGYQTIFLKSTPPPSPIELYQYTLYRSVCMSPYTPEAIPLYSSESHELDCIVFEHGGRLRYARYGDDGWVIRDLRLEALHRCLLYSHKGPSLDSLPDDLRDAVDVWAFEEESF